MINFKLFGSRVKNARKERFLTQEMLAEKLDVSVEYLSRIESGVCRPSFPLIEKIADLFGISEKTLLFGDDSSPENTALLEKIDLLPDEKKKVLSLILDLLP